MPEYFKQLANQLRSIWDRLNLTQRIVLVTTAVVSLLGMASIITWSSMNGKEETHATLFVNLQPEDGAEVTEALKEMGIRYQWENQGRSLVVEKMDVHEARMQLAKMGLPRDGSSGYEIFDELQLGMTDFVQNLNFQRALEGEIVQSIETLTEVDKARVHLTIPKPSLFHEKKVESTASIVLKMRPGKRLEESQIRGITHLVASSVEGLKARQVAILDVKGNLLTNGFADNALAEKMDHNMTLQKGVEEHLEKKIADMFEGLLGPNKARVKVSTRLNFEQVDKTIETYQPTSKVVRSQQREDGRIEDSPVTGDEQSENSITNYEIDKTIARVINAPGARDRTTVSLVVDGHYKKNEEGEAAFTPRSEEEIRKYTQLVKNTIGFRPDTDDAVYVTSIRFNRDFIEEERAAIARMERNELLQYWAKVLLIGLIILLGFIFLRSLARHIALAMNPPLPRFATPDLEPEEEAIPDNILRQKEMMVRIEELTQENPANVASLIKGWLQDVPNVDNSKGGRK